MAKGQDPQSRSGGVLNGVAECHIIYQGCNYGDWGGVGRDRGLVGIFIGVN